MDKEFWLLEAGSKLSPERVKNLESIIIEDPVDYSVRLKLIGYYHEKREFGEKFLSQLIWMIENAPERTAWRHIYYFGLYTKLDSKVLQKLGESWKAQVKRNPNSSSVIGNAGLFLVDIDFNYGDELLSKAMNMSQMDYLWPQCIQKLNFLEAEKSSGEEQKYFAEKSLKAGENLIGIFNSEGRRETEIARIRCIEKCARCAYFIKDYSLAQHYSKLHLKLISGWDPESQPKSTTSLMGLISLCDGDSESAKCALMKLSENCRLNKWDLELANEFIGIGEYEIALDYLLECKRLNLWRHAPLNKWIESVKQSNKIDYSA